MAKRNNSKTKKKTIIKKKTTSTTAYVVSTIIALIVIFAIFFMLKPNTIKDMFKFEPKESVDVEENLLAAIVNGEPIYLSALDEQYDALPSELKMFTTKENLLYQMIDELVLLDEAENQKIKISDAEIEEELNTLLEQSGLTMEDLEASLEERGSTIEEFNELFRKRLILTKLYEEKILSEIEVTREEARAYYDENLQLFEKPETVEASHILVPTEEEALEIKKELEEGVDFAELAKEKSTEPAAATSGGNLGEFPRGRMVKIFEDAAFALEEGELSDPVETQFGWHIILVHKKNPAGKVEFEEVEQTIIDTLKLQQSQEAFDIWMEELRDEAEIEIYYSETELEQELEEVVEELEDFEEEEIEEIELEPEEEVVEEPEEEEVEEIPEEEPEEEVVEEFSSFEECLTENKAVLYGAYWNKDTSDQLELFEEPDKLEYVECGVKGDYSAQTQECIDAGINGYPTWKIGSRTEQGIQTLERLKALTGCE